MLHCYSVYTCKPWTRLPVGFQPKLAAFFMLHVRDVLIQGQVGVTDYITDVTTRHMLPPVTTRTR